MTTDLSTTENPTDRSKEGENLRVWTAGQMLLATAIGGPLVGCYMLSKNFKMFDEPENAKKTVLFGCIGMLLFFIALSLIPEGLVNQIPMSVFPGMNAALISFFVHRFQKDKINELKKSGIKRNSYFKLVLISIVCLLLTLLLCFFMSFLQSFLYSN